jgi:hypothetical protein
MITDEAIGELAIGELKIKDIIAIIREEGSTPIERRKRLGNAFEIVVVQEQMSVGEIVEMCTVTLIEAMKHLSWEEYKPGRVQ